MRSILRRSVFFLLWAGVVQAGQPSQLGLEADLRQFAENPLQFSQRLPTRWGKRRLLPEGLRDLEGLSLAAQSSSQWTELLRERVVEEKIRLRDELKLRAGDALSSLGAIRLFSNPGLNDRPENLVDQPGKMLTTLETIESAGLRRARIADQPWSDTYWPVYQGGIGARYADPGFTENYEWKEFYRYVSAQSVEKLLKGNQPQMVERLSPSEKYESLMGIPSHITAAQWEQGKRYFDQTGEVETWMGLCHGWAPASFMAPRPLKAVVLKSFDGENDLKFFPSDIKALTTFAWATLPVPMRHVGGRCHLKKPPIDDNGRVLEADCFDTNPATWHLAVVNQLGVSGRSFVLDATYDYEVWNQPAVGYSYSYFNPDTLAPADTLQAGTVLLSAMRKDKFASYRSSQAVSVVGVSMTLTYGVESAAQAVDTDSPENDNLTTVRYLYDLELDAQGRIVGGEWYQSAHPDFLWVPEKGARAVLPLERSLPGQWIAGDRLPDIWQLAARRAGAAGLVLGRVIEALQAASRR